MLTHHPTLQLQRALYNLPKGRERFEAYLALMKDPATGDIKLPLSAMNPMGHSHLAELLDAYLAMDLDGQAGNAVRDWLKEAALQEAFAGLDMKTVFVLADDAKGQWTNRVAYAFDVIYHLKPLFRRGWLVALLWSSQVPDLDPALVSLKTILYRGAWLATYGFPSTLGEILTQEGWVAEQMNQTQHLSRDDLEYTHQVLKSHWDRTDEPFLIAVLFGDVAAASLGHPPLGLSPNAGLELAHYLRK